METLFYLMRKNEIITLVKMDENGNMVKYSPNIQNIDLAPFQYRYTTNWLKDWWNERSVPIRQGKIKEYLEKMGIVLPAEYLVRNLGLSLTDYYWIKPLESNLTWEEVNLFDNSFKDHLLSSSVISRKVKDSVSHYSPNGSLQGNIEKTWTILEDGSRAMIKGNRTFLSSESLNEIIATEIHRLQGYDHYTPYYPVRIKNSVYDYGCYSRIFTSNTTELISAYAIYTYSKKKNNISPIDHFIQICVEKGMDREQLQNDLDYLYLTDYIISGYDRHLNNIAVLRDDKTLKLTRLAPIFDSGGAFFVNRDYPHSLKELYHIKTNGFFEREAAGLNHIKDRKAIDLTLLPPASFIRKIYEMDTKAPKELAGKVSNWYEKKIDMCRAFQLGIDPNKRLYSIQPITLIGKAESDGSMK